MSGRRAAFSVGCCILLLLLPLTAADQFTVSHEDGHPENPAQSMWEKVKQFLKDLLPAPVVFFFENWDTFRGNETGENKG
jgi:hypothetical protein